MSINEIDEQKNELVNLKEKNREFFYETAQAVIKGRVQEFLNAFEDYFRERGFVIRKKDDSVRVAYETLHFKAFTNDRSEIFIMKGKEQIASITVNFISSRKSGDFKDSRDYTEEETLLNQLLIPMFYCSGSDFGRPYDSPLSVLESIFNG